MTCEPATPLQLLPPLPITTAMNTRLAAIYVLYDVIVGRRSLSPTLNEQLIKISNPPDKGLTQEIVYGTLRNYRSLQLTLKPFLNKPIPEKNKPLEIVLCAALYQLLMLNLPSYAVINESVKATKDIDFEWAKGFVNGVLRSVIRTPDLTLRNDPQQDHPAWLAQLIRNHYPNDAERIFANNHHPAHIMLRVRPQHYSRDAYLQLLLDEGFPAAAHNDNKDCIVLTGHANVTRLPGFEEGHITVQDASAQLAANLLGVKPGMHILDACAAPGGKTAHIFDKADNTSITAIDNVESRVATLTNTLERLQVQATVVTADINDTQAWFDGQQFDRILLDAPCSATGVIRKNPDILFHRRKHDITNVVSLQREILATCWGLLKPGGRLLYATCSILPQENQEQMQQFLRDTDDAIMRPLAHNRAVPDNSGMVQFLPDEHGDGFFYTLIEKS